MKAPSARPALDTAQSGELDPGRRSPVLLEAVGLSCGYGALPVIRELDLTVRSGEVVALIGANGAGKTTTLLALAGELGLTSGEVRIGGSRTTDPLHVRSRRGLAFVPDERSVIPSLSTMDNLRLGPGRVSHALDLFPELKPLLKRPAGLLSGGEQQILTLARALASSPKVLLADEISLGLAPLITARILRAVREAADRGVAVLIVEQHLRAALSVSDYGYVLRRGSVAIHGRASDLSARMSEIEDTYLATSQELLS
jgi:branched-chain amino acid transport system ATP-binding protein